MCGIVGGIGHNRLQTLILNGLEKLEYRGYDSAGLFFVRPDGTDVLVKRVGRIMNLRSDVDESATAVAGLGHTRWATHGSATEANAHPHLSADGRFTLVHNGVIENFKELTETYLKAVALHSQTDTEVVVNLVAHFANQDGLSAKEAFRRALTVIKGSYAFGLLDRETPGVLYAAKHKSPLLVGLGQGFNVITSDAMATINETKTYLEIKDGEVLTLTEEGVTIETLEGQSVERAPYEAELDADDLEKGTYPHFMLKEIDEQPAVLRRLVQIYKDGHDEFVVAPEILETILASDRIYIVACGTSNHAGWIGKTLIEKVAHIPVEVHLASEFAYHMPLLSEKPFFIFLSQSGETADSRQALVKVNEANYPSLTITNVKGSTLSREATFTLLLHAGPEIAVASTKAYTAQITVMAILAEVVGRAKGLAALFDMAHEIGIIASAIEGLLSTKEEIKALADENLLTTRNAFYIGRLIDYYVAMEAALKLKEISYVQTEAFASGELKHGTIALIEEGTPVIAIISDPLVASHTRGNLEETKARGANTLVISTEETHEEGDAIVLPRVEAALSPLLTVVVTQLIAYYVSLGRGLDVDKPRNLAKSVTVE